MAFSSPFIMPADPPLHLKLSNVKHQAQLQCMHCELGHHHPDDQLVPSSRIAAQNEGGGSPVSASAILLFQTRMIFQFKMRNLQLRQRESAAAMKGLGTP